MNKRIKKVLKLIIEATRQMNAMSMMSSYGAELKLKKALEILSEIEEEDSEEVEGASKAV